MRVSVCVLVQRAATRSRPTREDQRQIGVINKHCRCVAVVCEVDGVGSSKRMKGEAHTFFDYMLAHLRWYPLCGTPEMCAFIIKSI